MNDMAEGFAKMAIFLLATAACMSAATFLAASGLLIMIAAESGKPIRWHAAGVAIVGAPDP